MQYRLDSITKSIEKQRYSAGYCVYDLTADSMLYRYNSQKRLKPASTQKLFTSITALSTIGTDYNFQTYAYVDGNIHIDANGRRYWDGDICICGSFDPTLQIDAAASLGEKILNLQVDSISGNIIVDNRVKLDMKKIKDEQTYFGSSLYEYLSAKGIKFASNTPYATSSEPLSKGWCIGVVNTPITNVLPRMLKRSDNTYAECMLLNLWGMGHDSGWTYDRCREQVHNTIVNANGNLNDYTIIDGSGLSHDNRSTPELLTTLLRYAFHNKEIFPLIYENLPIAGVDGTLSERMKKGPAFNNVRAKTGTLNGVSTLSGYVTASNGHTLAFAILVNDVVLAKGKALQNDICQELAR